MAHRRCCVTIGGKAAFPVPRDPRTNPVHVAVQQDPRLPWSLPLFTTRRTAIFPGDSFDTLSLSLWQRLVELFPPVAVLAARRMG